MINFFKSWWILILAIFVVLGGSLPSLLNGKDWSIVYFYKSFETPLTIALGILGFIGYYEYIKENNKKRAYKKRLKNLDVSEIDDNHIALLIQFGGKGNNIKEMTRFIKNNLKIKDENIISQKFGDKNNSIKLEDIEVLKSYCKDIKEKISLSNGVHIFYGGMGVGYAVIADMLKNTTNMYFYHKNGGPYEIWYTDSKSELRRKDTLKSKFE
jgi:hypothetical protein